MEGLKWHYQNQLSIIDPPNYKELVEAVLCLDASVRHTEPLRLNQNLKGANEYRPSQSNVSHTNSKAQNKHKKFKPNNNRQ
jgi:hypothetical protein